MAQFIGHSPDDSALHPISRTISAYEHIHRDQASVLVQIGLLDPANLPVAGAEQAERLLTLAGAG